MPKRKRWLVSEVALLASSGALLLVRRFRLGWRRDGRLPAEGLVPLTVGGYFVGISTHKLVGWSRYALPNLLLGTILSGGGEAATAPRNLLTCPCRPRRPTRTGDGASVPAA